MAPSASTLPPRSRASRRTAAAAALGLCWWPFPVLVWLAVQVRADAGYQVAGGFLLAQLGSWILGTAIAVHEAKAPGALRLAWGVFVLCLVPVLLALLRVPSLVAAWCA